MLAQDQETGQQDSGNTSAFSRDGHLGCVATKLAYKGLYPLQRKVLDAVSERLFIGDQIPPDRADRHWPLHYRTLRLRTENQRLLAAVL